MYAVAIDGPAGAGKSTISRAVAQKIGFLYVDTGALYRAVAYDMLENRIDPSDIHAVCERLAHITVRLGYENGDQQIYLNGKNITEKIRTPQISAAASTVSSIGEVRQFSIFPAAGYCPGKSYYHGWAGHRYGSSSQRAG